MSKMKYKTYKELFAAYKSGELKKENVLFIDSEVSFVYVGKEKVFKGKGDYDIFEILEAIGIPVEEV